MISSQIEDYLCCSFLKKRNMKNSKLLSAFAWVAILEGISFLVLMVGSLMKRDMLGDVETGSWIVQNIGMAHGILFVLYVLLLLQCKSAFNWSIKKVMVYFLLSFVPFGTFWVDRRIAVEKRALNGAA
jgi:integral membrane protein